MNNDNRKPPSLGALLLVFGMTASAMIGVPAMYLYHHHDAVSKFLENIDNVTAPAQHAPAPTKTDTVKTHEPH